MSLIRQCFDRVLYRRIEARNLQNGHSTVVQVTRYKANENVPDQIFTTRELARD